VQKTFVSKMDVWVDIAKPKEYNISTTNTIHGGIK
jgi:hypothetical protein